MAEITKSYEPAEVEKKWYQAWLKEGAFAGRVDPAREPYCIVIPPPNVTGVLTMGHVLNNAIQDILIRRARLEGRGALWIPGTDHAGIATQTVVERELRKTKKTRRDFGREAFVARVVAWRQEKGDIILEQLRRLGASCDWDRTHFTMDPGYSRAVLTAFVELFRRGAIYRGKRLVNWCPASQTALSDEEVIMKPVNGTLYQVRYEVVDRPGEFIAVKTTRPETIPGDVAIAVHPQDPRYAALLGRRVWRPLNRLAIPIIADAAVDREFGTGALKITPAHDRVDFEIGLRHGLPPVDVLNADGSLNDLAGPELAGLDRFAGRKKAAELLRSAGALVAEEAYANNVGYSERADVPIEPRLTWQWWLRYPRVEEAKAAVRDGTITFHPERWSKVYLHWLENIQDWCISRQLWWGHRIPVWYRKGLDREKSLAEADLRDPAKVHISLDGPPDPENWEQEEDVLDTWASSWLWPFATLGWPDPAAMKSAGFDYFYPTTTLVTGPDIIFFWVARMIMAGLEFIRPGEPLERRIPFRHVYFTGIIRDAQGRKMSKSLGNSPDPLDLIARYGADGLRFGIVSIAPQGQDIRFQEERIEAGKNFCNKLWNAARFRLRSGPSGGGSLESLIQGIDFAALDDADHFLLHQILETAGATDQAFRDFEFSAALQKLYAFFWNDFCDWYVEVSKTKLQSDATRANCLRLQDLALRQSLLLLHPFIPFITEELWHLLGFGPEGEHLMSRRDAVGRPELEKILSNRGYRPNASAVAHEREQQQFVSQARALKAEHALASRRDVRLYLVASDAAWTLVAGNLAQLQRMAGAAEILRRESVEGAPATVTPLGTLYLELAGTVDAAAEQERLRREREKIALLIAATEARLANPAFTGKAPPAVIAGAQKQLSELQAKLAEIDRLLRQRAP